MSSNTLYKDVDGDKAVGVKIYFNTYLGFITPPPNGSYNWPCYQVKRTFLTRVVRMDNRFVSFTFGAVLLSYQCFINSLIEPRAEKKNEPQEWREWTRDLSLLPFGFCLATNVSFFQLVRKV